MQRPVLRSAIVNAASAFSLPEIAHHHKQLPRRNPDDDKVQGPECPAVQVALCNGNAITVTITITIALVVVQQQH